MLGTHSTLSYVSVSHFFKKKDETDEVNFRNILYFTQCTPNTIRLTYN
jgi:hypothetical protein